MVLRAKLTTEVTEENGEKNVFWFFSVISASSVVMVLKAKLTTEVTEENGEKNVFWFFSVLSAFSVVGYGSKS
ncbi:hypothetical protein GF407_04815 [candidate division KSB1 bacterium]|nr:hypothetical protein [candidate division KSB1 bacterium]